MKNSIISTGGGAILNPENILNLKANGRFFFLDRKPEDLVPTDDRPLANDDRHGAEQRASAAAGRIM